MSFINLLTYASYLSYFFLIYLIRVDFTVNELLYFLLLISW